LKTNFQFWIKINKQRYFRSFYESEFGQWKNHFCNHNIYAVNRNFGSLLKELCFHKGLDVFAAMHIILTHEQADFDALASLLGAYLLNDAAVPVLPRRMNRNTRAFLTLYGMNLPFVDPRDLPKGPIDSVTLVDTQSLISLKGMQPDVMVRVIDHHPLRGHLPENWSVTTVEIGATTTLLVEALRERNGMLSVIQATLLLLGIYEDTGSLTYTRTTSRDLQAAAYLLGQGASLDIAAKFLNHPLTHEQQSLYDQLRENAEYHAIHGHSVLVACGDAQNVDEELSTIVHKLRDLLDPDALIVIVTTRGGVQMIARSTSDNIDVAELVAEFGGGGHARAAASLIRDRDMESICQQLEAVLPKHVQPAVTVAEIMSLGPMLLSPNTSVSDALNRMQRYGYEGYPVVEDGKVVGLLTRRAVDRAISHKLNLTAASLMEAGNFSVTPEDSIEKLQRLMTDSDWGQIPVVDPHSRNVIGIVTRTDLIKTLTRKLEIPGRLNLASRLESALPVDRLDLIKIIAQAAYKQRAALYIVGGFVRDLLVERPSLDFDLVVEGDAIALARSLAREYGGRVTSHSRFGTAKWHLKENDSDGEENELAIDELDSVDLVSARTEFYNYPTALPTVERGSIKLDLHRRDFTINTLALRLDGHHYGELHDYWGGLNDLRSGWVRVLHSLSFVDDPTRILRAVRFEQRFSFSIEDRTMQLLIEARSLIDRLSGDRIRHELNHILSSVYSPKILARLSDLELLEAIHPYLVWDQWLNERMNLLVMSSPDAYWELYNGENGRSLRQDLGYVLWLIRLSQKDASAAARRLKLPANLVRVIMEACHLWSIRSELTYALPSMIVANLDKVSPLALYALYIASMDDALMDKLKTYKTKWQHITPHMDGNDLKSLGLPPGPIYRDILRKLRAAWLDSEISSLDEENELLNQLIHDLNQEPENSDHS
jgi:tRNA nucleotidyltransferase (CCA-adding enzyme)